jgi:hypothetical protein
MRTQRDGGSGAAQQRAPTGQKERKSVRQTALMSIVVAAGAAVTAAQTPQYSVELLPQIQTPSGPTNVGGAAMNDLGWVVGDFFSSQPGDPYATKVALYRPGQGWLDLGFAPGMGAMRAVDITNDGMVVGYGSPTSVSIGYNGRAWTWRDGQFTVYPQMIPGRHTQPGLTNEAGRLVGSANDGTFTGMKAVEFAGGATTPLLPASVPGSNTALDVNNQNVVLGTEILGVFLWRPGQERWYFPPPPGLPIVDYSAINDHDDAVGMARAAGHTETRTAVVWLDGAGWQVIPRNARRCNARRINNLREVIGSSQDNTGAIGDHGWYWRPGLSGLSPLEYMIADPPSVYAVGWASDINQRSEILAGVSVRATGQGHAAILRPIIEGPLRLDLASKTPPGLARPGIGLEIRLRIMDGTQSYQAGTAQVHYRMNPSGAFSSAPLQSVGAGMHAAVLPAPSCGDAPQMYFSAQGSGGATVMLPAGAPGSLLNIQVGETQTIVPLDESFESGVLPAGWSATGLWNVTTQCSSAGAGQCYDSGNASAYYGITGQCNFSTGGVHSGVLTSPPVTLPEVAPGGEIRLTYCSNRGTDSVNNSSTAELLVNGVVKETLTGWNPSWERRVVDMTAYAGQTVILEWKFATGIFGTDARGWNIGSVKLAATTSGCTGPSCYANCDQSTAAPVLNVADFSCFLQKFAAGEPYANCDGSTAAPVLNVADFSCFLQKFAAGCP